MSPHQGLSGPDAAMIEEVIDTQIRPLLRVHGGDLVLLGTADGELDLEFEGACRACALKTVTYAIGVRERLRHLPGVRKVGVRGVNLSNAALERVARAYANHPLLPTAGAATAAGGGTTVPEPVDRRPDGPRNGAERFTDHIGR